MIEKESGSPCNGTCWLDDNDVCIGCNRTAVEIFNTGREVKWPDPNLPPVNLNNSLSADKFYPDDEAPPNGGLDDAV